MASILRIVPMPIYIVSRPVCYESIDAHRNEDWVSSLEIFLSYFPFSLLFSFREFHRPLYATIRIEDAVTSFMMVEVEVSVVQSKCSNRDPMGCMWFENQDLTLPRLVDCWCEVSWLIVAEDCRLEGINLHRDLTVYHEEPQAVGDLRLGARYFVGGYLAMIEQLGNEFWGS